MNVKRKKRFHVRLIYILIFFIVLDLVGINYLFAANSTSTTACISICPSLPCDCVVPICGNGSVEGAEECDDDNLDSGDGCSSSCITEYCGDNVANNTDEICDSNTTDCVDNDYNGNKLCNATCDGWESCVLDESCGDGVINGNEICDDGNSISCDGCREDCTRTDNVCDDGYLECDEVCDGELGVTSSLYICSDDCSELEQVISGGNGPIFVFLPPLVDLEDDEDEEVDLESKNKTKKPQLGGTGLDALNEIQEQELEGLENIQLERKKGNITITKVKKEANVIRMIDFDIGENKVIGDGSINKEKNRIIENKRPTISGRIDEPGAYIYLKYIDNDKISAVIRTDENGFWSWEPTDDFNLGKNEIYVTIHDKEDRFSGVYYSFIFNVESGQYKSIITEDEEKKLSTVIVKKSDEKEISRFKEAIKIETILQLSEFKRDYVAGSRIEYTFDIRNNSNKDHVADVRFKLLNMNKQILQEKKEQVFFKQNFSLSSFFDTEKNYNTERYYIEANLEINDLQLINSINFKISSEGKERYWGLSNIFSNKNLQILKYLFFSLWFFFIILLVEFIVLHRLKQYAEIDDWDLKTELI